MKITKEDVELLNKLQKDVITLSQDIKVLEKKASELTINLLNLATLICLTWELGNENNNNQTH